MKKMAGVLVALVTLGAQGCSTVPVSAEQARAVPQDRIYQGEYLRPAADRSAEIYVARDKGFGGSGCSHDLYLNNQKVLALRQSEAVTLHVAPGSYFIKIETGGGLCPNISTSQNLLIADGERQDYRILLPSDGSLRLTRER